MKHLGGCKLSTYSIYSQKCGTLIENPQIKLQVETSFIRDVALPCLMTRRSSFFSAVEITTLLAAMWNACKPIETRERLHME